MYLDVCARAKYKSLVPPSQRNNEVLPDVGASWRWGKIEGRFYYDYNRIPNRAPNYYRSALGTEYEVIHQAYNPLSNREIVEQAKKRLQEEVEQYIIHSHEHYYMYKAPNTFHREVAISIARAMGYAKMLLAIRKDKGWKRYGIETIGAFDAMAAELLGELQLKGMSVSNANALRRKLDEFEILDTEVKQLHYMMPKNYGNTNRCKVGTIPIEQLDKETGEIVKLEVDIHETLMYYYFMNKANAAIEFKTTLYNNYYLRDMEALGLSNKVVSFRTFCHHTEKFSTKVKAHRERYGKDNYNKKLLTYVPMEKLKYSCSLWVADGSGLKIGYKGTNGTESLYAMRVFDVASTALIGYAIAINQHVGEDKEYVNNALLMAIEVAEGYGAMDFLTDNGKGFSTSEMQEKFKMLFGKMRRIAVGNSQENDAERFNKLMNNGARQFDNWRGQFQAKDKEYKANPDKMIAVSKDEVMMQALTIIEQYNNHIGPDGLTRMERFLQNRHPEAKKIDDKVMRYVFGNESKVDLSYMRGFVLVTKDDVERKFVIPPLRKGIADQVRNDEGSLVETYEMLNRAMGNTGYLDCMVKWDEKVADIYTLEGRFLLSCEAVKKGFKSHAEATEATMANTGKLRARKLKQIAATEAFSEKIAEGMNVLQDKQVREQLDYTSPNLITSGEEQREGMGELVDYGVLVASGAKVKARWGEQEDIVLNNNVEGTLKLKVQRKSISEESLNDL
ncbi:MAG: hypothetical protein ACRC4N_10645 [Gammaproteobacteria bacterium]